MLILTVAPQLLQTITKRCEWALGAAAIGKMGIAALKGMPLEQEGSSGHGHHWCDSDPLVGRS